MTDTRSDVRDEVLSTADKGLPEEMLADLTVEEVERAIDRYQRVADLETRVERIAPRFVKWEILRYLMAQRGIMFEYIEMWPDETVLDDLRTTLDDGAYDEAKLETVERLYDGAPTGYVELVEDYVDLTDGLLDDLEYATHGDPMADGTVRIVCEPGGRQFEAVLETEDAVDDVPGLGEVPTRLVDVDGLGDFLNRVLAETTDDDRRFCWTDVGLGHQIGVWFLEDVPCQMMQTFHSWN